MSGNAQDMESNQAKEIRLQATKASFLKGIETGTDCWVIYETIRVMDLKRGRKK